MKNKIRFILLIIFLGALSFPGAAVNPAMDCTSHFTWEQLNNANTTIKFYNESSGDFNTWMWDFGDGLTSGIFHPEHVYASYGTYYVCLTISDGIACTDVFCDTVEVIPQCNASFEYSFVPTTPIHIQFADISTGNPTAWTWDFGDGTYSSEQNPVHPYPVPGVYEVCLIIEHDAIPYYCIDSVCMTIEIPDSVACEAMFLYELDPYFPLEVTFIDLSVGVITDWEWDFGDGTTSTDQNPVHIFPQTGDYLVCLNVFNADSVETCFHFICETLNIPDSLNCTAEFSFMADSSSNNINEFTFYDKSYGYPDHWLWEFGDGGISHEQNPVHIYSEPGMYEVCLNSWNSNYPACNDTRCLLVQTPSYYKLGGQAFIGSTPINNPYPTGDTGVAILYRQRPDLRLVAVDTNIFIEHGYYWFSDKMELPYVIRISLTGDSEHYEEVIPSYYPSAMIWEQSGSVILSEDMYEIHTSLIELNESGTGIGGIKGRVINNLTYDLSQTQGYNDVPVILTDDWSQPLAWTLTNQFGQFSFSNLAFGSYLVYADIAGLYSLPESVILDEQTPVADSIFIKMSETALLGIHEPGYALIDIMTLYPNPARNSLYLDLNALEPAMVNISIYNQIGQQCIIEEHMVYKGEHKLEINISNLPESIYFLRLQSTDSTPLMRTFIKAD